MIGEAFDKSLNTLVVADILPEIGAFDAATNRAYYSMFGCVRALLADVDPTLHTKSHAGALKQLAKHYVRPGRIPEEVYKAVARAENDRNRADYGFTPPSEEMARQHVAAARRFAEMTVTLLARHELPDGETTLEDSPVRLKAARRAQVAVLVDAVSEMLTNEGIVVEDGFYEELEAESGVRELVAILGRPDELRSDYRKAVAVHVALPSFSVGTSSPFKDRRRSPSGWRMERVASVRTDAFGANVVEDAIFHGAAGFARDRVTP